MGRGARGCDRGSGGSFAQVLRHRPHRVSRPWVAGSHRPILLFAETVLSDRTVVPFSTLDTAGMPVKPSVPAPKGAGNGTDAVENEGDGQPGGGGGVAAVDRALRVLLAFREGDTGLTLGELSRRTGLYKSALSRLMVSLERHRFAQRLPDGRFGLGPSLHRLAGLFERSLDPGSAIEPALHALAEETGESASFYIRERQFRLCLMRVDSGQNVRDHVRVGSLLPLDRGAAGRILNRFEDGPAQAEAAAFVAVSIGERDREMAAVAAPVFGARSRLLGALCVSGTATRFADPAKVEHARQAVLRYARRLTDALGGDGRVFDGTSARTA